MIGKARRSSLVMAAYPKLQLCLLLLPSLEMASRIPFPTFQLKICPHLTLFTNRLLTFTTTRIARTMRPCVVIGLYAAAACQLQGNPSGGLHPDIARVQPPVCVCAVSQRVAATR